MEKNMKWYTREEYVEEILKEYTELAKVLLPENEFYDNVLAFIRDYCTDETIWEECYIQDVEPKEALMNEMSYWEK